MADTSLYLFIGIIGIGIAYAYFYVPNYENTIPLILIFTFAGIALGGTFA